MHAVVDVNTPSRKLLRMLRNQPDLAGHDGDMLPESVLWMSYCELRRRGDDRAAGSFLRSVKTLHRRRCLGSAELPTKDPATREHELVDDPLLAELWKAYKRCICSQRTGPASQLLRDIEAQIVQH
jgi:hypothetical protein